MTKRREGPWTRLLARVSEGARELGTWVHLVRPRDRADVRRRQRLRAAWIEALDRQLQIPRAVADLVIGPPLRLSPVAARRRRRPSRTP